MITDANAFPASVSAPAPAPNPIDIGSTAALTAPIPLPAPAAAPIKYTPTPDELASAAPAETVKYTPTPDELQTASTSPGKFSPLKDLSSAELVQEAKDNPKDFDPISQYQSLPFTEKTPELEQKMADVYLELWKSGTIATAATALGKNLLQLPGQFLNRLYTQGKNLPGMVMAAGGANLAPTTTAGILAGEGSKTAAETVAGTKSALFGIPKFGSDILAALNRTVGTGKPLEQYTPEEKLQAFRDEIAVRGKMAQLGSGGPAAETLASKGFAVDPEKVAMFAATDPASWALMGKTFEGITPAVKTGAAAMLGATPAQFAEAFAPLGETASRVSQKATGGMISALGEVSKGTAKVAQKLVSPLGKPAGAIGGAVTGAHIAGIPGAVFGAIEGAEKGAKTSALIGTGLEKVAGAGADLSEMGKQIAGNAPVTSRWAQLGKDVSAAAPGAAGQVVKGLAMDIALQEPAAKTPAEREQLTPFGTTFGVLGAGHILTGRALSGQIVGVRDWGSDIRTPSTGNFPALATAHDAAYNSAGRGIQRRINAVRQYQAGIDPNSEFFNVPEPKEGETDTLPQILEGMGLPADWANHAGATPTDPIRGADGNLHRIIITRNVDAAPHEATHQMDNVIGADAVQNLNAAAKQQFSGLWDSISARYAASLLNDSVSALTAQGVNPAEALKILKLPDNPTPQEIILTLSGKGNQFAQEKIAHDASVAFDESGVTPTDEQLAGETGPRLARAQSDADASSVPLWKQVLTPEEANFAHDQYVGNEVRAEHGDAWFKAGQDENTLGGKMWRAAANMADFLGVNPVEGRVSEGQGLPLQYKTLREVAGQAKGIIPPKVNAAKLPRVIAPPGSPQAAAQQKERDQQIVASAPDVKLPGQVKSQKEMMGALNEAKIAGAPVDIQYGHAGGTGPAAGALDEPPPAILGSVNRGERREFIEAWRSMPIDTRTFFGTLFSPENFNLTKSGKYQVYGGSHAVLAANAQKLATFASEHPEFKLPNGLQVDPATKTFTPESWKYLFDRVQDYSRNQLSGRTGAGGELVVPKMKGYFAPPVTGEAQPIPQDIADVINGLYGQKTPETARITKKDILPLNIAGQRIAEATQPGRVATPTAESPVFGEQPGTEAEQRAKGLGIKGQHVLEPNPFLARLNSYSDAPSFIEARQRLNLEHMADVNPAPAGAPMLRGNTLTMAAGFAPKTPIEITGPDGKKYQASFDGYQDMSILGRGFVPQITPLEDIPGVTKAKSTTYGPSLTGKGYKLPTLPAPPESATAQFLPQPAEEARRALSNAADVTKDENGVPKVFFHGTRSTEELVKSGKFDITHANPTAFYGPGFYFTDDPITAGGTGDPKDSFGYAITGAKGETPGVVPVFLDVKNPFRIDKNYTSLEISKIFQKFQEQVKGPDMVNRPSINPALANAVDKVIENQGAHTRQNMDLAVDNEYEPYQAAENAGWRPNETEKSRVSDFIKEYLDWKHSNERGRLAILAKQLRNLHGEASGQDIYDSLIEFTNDEYNPSWFTEKGGANDLIKGAGFDGITHVGGAIMGRNPHRVVVAFDPTQVHGAYGGTVRKVKEGAAQFQPGDFKPTPALSETGKERDITAQKDYLGGGVKSAQFMHSLEGIRKMNDEEIARRARQGETETTRNSSYAGNADQGVVLHSAKQRSTMFVKPGAPAEKFLKSWESSGDLASRNKLVESYFGSEAQFQPQPKTFIVRHGSTEMNNADPEKDLIRGHIDVPLDEKGRREAESTADQITAAGGVHHIITSDLQRTRETADAIAAKTGATVESDPGLRPWNLGSTIEGHPTAKMLPKIAKLTENPDQRPPGGETFNEFKNRFLDAFHRAQSANPDKDTAIVTHYRGTKLLDAWRATGVDNDTIDKAVFESYDKDKQPGNVDVVDKTGAAIEPGAEAQFATKRKSKQDFELKEGGPGMFVKGWILPDGKLEQFGEKLHHTWLNENPDVSKKYGLKVGGGPSDDINIRNRALQKGFARVNYQKNTGTLMVEAREKDWPGLIPSVKEIARINLGKIDNMDVRLFDPAVKGVTQSDGVALHTYDANEKMDHLPLISEPTSSVTETSPQATPKPETAQFAPKTPRPLSTQNNAQVIDDAWEDNPGSPAFWISPDGGLLNSPGEHEQSAREYLNLPAKSEVSSNEARKKMAQHGWRRVIATPDDSRIYVSGYDNKEDLTKAQRNALELLAIQAGAELIHDLERGPKTLYAPPNPPEASFQTATAPKESDFKSEDTLPAALKSPNWAILTAENPNAQTADAEFNKQANENLEHALIADGYNPVKVVGGYKGTGENSFLVPGMTPQEAQKWRGKYNQESVLINKGFLYGDNTLAPANHENTVVGPTAEKLDYFSKVPGGPAFSMGVDFAKRVPFSKPQQELLGGGVAKPVLSSHELGQMGAPEMREHYPEAVVPNRVRNKAGELVDPTIDSDIRNAPAWKGLAEKEAVTKAADKLVEEHNKWKDHPIYKAGLKWYEDFTPKLKAVFGKHAQLMAELLAATSPNTTPDINFAFAHDALEGYKAGRFDKQIKKFEEGLAKIKDGSWETWMKRTKSEGSTEEAFLKAWSDKNKLAPTQSNGKRYGMHSDAVLQVVARRWLSDARGPKTLNFVKNLLGTGHEATIDVWADRTMRRMGYEGSSDRWRILPQNATGVSDADFAFSQKAFREAADRVGVKPDALQGGLWFAEKQHWADNGWGRLDLGDFRKEIEKVPMLKSGIEQRLAATKARAKTKTGEPGELFGAQFATHPLFHGTKAEFENFEPSENSSLGFHFGSKEQASTRALSGGRTGARVMGAAVTIDNPLRTRDAGDWSNPYSAWDSLNKATKGKFEDLKNLMIEVSRPKQERLSALKDRLKSLGYDGIVYKNQVEGRGDSYVTLSQSQIKPRVPTVSSLVEPRPTR